MRRQMIYLSNTMVRFDDKSKLKSSEAFGIDGALVDITLVKSRTNKANQIATLVFNQETGFDDELSLFVMLKDAGKVKGAGAFLYFEGRDDIKFAQKNFKQKLHDNPELQEIFTEAVVAHLTEEIDSQYDNMRKAEEYEDLHISNNIMAKMNARIA